MNDRIKCGYCGKCVLCRYAIKYPKYRAGLGVTIEIINRWTEQGITAQTLPASSDVLTDECKYRGEKLLAGQAAKLELNTVKNWYPCDHPSKPLGDYVCGCKGCGVNCVGYVPEGATPLEFVPGVVDPLPFPWRSKGAWNNQPSEDKRHAAALRQIANIKHAPPEMSGTGVIICADGDYAPLAAVALRLLRQHGCHLPVEVWYRPWAGGCDARLFAGLKDVTLVDAGQWSTRIPKRPELGGWSLKLHALVHTKYRHVIQLDADCFPLANVTPLGWYAERHSFAFWSDPGVDNEKWTRIGVENINGVPPIQSGQLAINRAACWQELVFARWMSEHEDFYWPNGPGQSNILYGDQSAWRVAFALTGLKPSCLGEAKLHPHVGFSYSLWGHTILTHPCLLKPKVGGYPGEALIFSTLAATIREKSEKF